jgi:5-hydroxyisourate hydrolase-like protein (transthyretin family)
MMSGVPLSGRVVDADTGQPIAGVRVKGWYATGKVTSDAPAQFRWNENVFTDKDGPLRLRRRSGQKCPVPFPSRRLRRARFEFRDIPSGKPNVQDFKLKRGVVLEGIIRNRRDSKPLANVTVKASDNIVPRYHGKSSADGVFRITGVKRGRLRFTLEAKGFSAPPDVREVTDAENSTPERPNRLRFFMEPSGAVAGVVTLPDGTPAAGARVWLARNAMLTNSIMPDSETRADAQGAIPPA